MSVEFNNAVEFVSNLPPSPPLSNDQKLELYGLFKCVTIGPNPVTARPNIFDFTGRAKWDAWYRIGKSFPSKHDACIRYLSLAREFGWEDAMGREQHVRRANNDSDVDLDHLDDDDKGNNDRDLGRANAGGMGTKVSTMSRGDEGECRWKNETIHDVVVSGDAGALKRYLKAEKMDPTKLDEQDEFGLTPLHLAADRGLYAMAKLLLSHGAERTSKVRCMRFQEWTLVPTVLSGQRRMHSARACAGCGTRRSGRAAPRTTVGRTIEANLV